MYMYGIYHTYTWICNIHGICMVYTIHIPCITFIAWGVPDVCDGPRLLSRQAQQRALTRTVTLRCSSTGRLSLRVAGCQWPPWLSPWRVAWRDSGVWLARCHDVVAVQVIAAEPPGPRLAPQAPAAVLKVRVDVGPTWLPFKLAQLANLTRDCQAFSEASGCHSVVAVQHLPAQPWPLPLSGTRPCLGRFFNLNWCHGTIDWLFQLMYNWFNLSWTQATGCYDMCMTHSTLDASVSDLYLFNLNSIDLPVTLNDCHVLDQSNLSLVDSTCIWLIQPDLEKLWHLHDPFNMYLIHSTWTWWIQHALDQFNLCLVDSTCVWLIQHELDSCDMCMTGIWSHSTCIWSIQPELDGFNMYWINPTWVWLIQHVYDWFNLSWTVLTCAWPIQHVSDPFNLNSIDLTCIASIQPEFGFFNWCTVDST